MSEAPTNTEQSPEKSESSEETPPRHVPIAEHVEERQRRQAAEKAAEALKAQLDEINRANESELDKARREATEAREQANQAAAEAIRFRIAAEKGITDNVDLILTAGDEDTMRRQADLWVSRTPETTAGPRPDLTQGGSGQPPALNSDGLEDALRSKLGI